jgi:hypothetical protein
VVVAVLFFVAPPPPKLLVLLLQGLDGGARGGVGVGETLFVRFLPLDCEGAAAVGVVQNRNDDSISLSFFFFCLY